MPVHVTTTTTQSLSNKTFVGPTRFNGDVTIFGNLSCSGTQTFQNTVFSTTSAVSVVHVGSGPALWVGNNGTGDIASFNDIDQGIEVFHIGGANGTHPNVGVKTSTPNVDFTVNGAISASSTIYDASGNSNQWNSTYSTVQTNSATNWNYQGTDIKALTGNWQNTYTTVSSYSATWGRQTLSFNESNAQLTISDGNTVSLSALSGGNRSITGAYLPLSGGTITGVLSTTNTIYTNNGNSDQWNNTYSTVQTSSGSWGGGGEKTAIGITIDGAGSAITTGAKGSISIPYNATFDNVTMIGDVSGLCIVDILKSDYNSYPTLSSICSTSLPTISSAIKSVNVTLSGWDKNIQSGNILKFQVLSASNITKLNLTIGATKY
jgi:hypothetical protein